MAKDLSGDVDQGISLTIRILDPGIESGLRRESRLTGVSMEDLVRSWIHEKLTKRQSHQNPAEAFARFFGEEHGIDLPLPIRRPHKPLTFENGEDE